MNNKAIVSEDERFRAFCEEIGEGKYHFFKNSLINLVTWKVWLGRKLTTSEFYGKYGEGFFKRVSEETGISETSLKDCAEVYKAAKLSSATEKKFIKEFPENFASWNDAKRKLLGRGSKSATDGELGDSGDEASSRCGHCPLHCPIN
jgi:hypothetical protein